MDGWVDGRMDRREPEFNATRGPQLSTKAEFRSVDLVSWGQVWQNFVGWVGG